jgi:hypothetical protein
VSHRERIAMFVTAYLHKGKARKRAISSDEVLLDQWLYRHEALADDEHQ